MTEWPADSDWKVYRGNKWLPMCRLCFEPSHDGPCEKSDKMIEYWNARADDADADAARCRGRAFEIANRQIAELAQLRAALAQAQAERDGLLAEIKELRERLAHEGAEVENCLKNIAELTTQRRALEIELSDALEELRLIKQTTRPVPGGLLDEKNQHGEYSMDTLPFDYQAYGIAGEPGHDTSGKPCWCGATADGAGVIVHRDIAEVMTSARQLGQFDAQPDYAAARSAVESELRAIANIHGTSDGLEPLDSVTGMLSQISDIIAGVASQRDAARAQQKVALQRWSEAIDARDAATRRAEQAEAVAAEIESAALADIVSPDTNASHMAISEAIAETCRRIRSVLAGPEGGER